MLPQPDIVIVEGVNVLQTPSRRGRAEASVVVSDFFDFSIYVDAERGTISKSWYVDRAAAAARDVAARPALVLQLPHAVRPRTTTRRVRARRCGAQINLVNLRENIAPTRGRAHLVLEKGRDHARPARAAAEALAAVASDRSASVRTPRRPNQASSEIHARELVAVDDGVRVASARAGRPTRPCRRARSASTWRCVVGGGDLDERRDRLGRGVEDRLDDARELRVGCGSTCRTGTGTPSGRSPRTGSRRGSRASTRSRPTCPRPRWPRRAWSSSWRPVSSSSSTYSARLLGKCW